MSREIKFRAWHKTEQTMYVVSKLYFKVYPADIPGAQLASDEKRVITGAFMDDLELMQFTGWHDHSKPAKEVYESDIVQFIDGHHGVVTWDIINDGWRIRVGNTFLLRDNEMIVIGNIYEHPHLLEAQL